MKSISLLSFSFFLFNSLFSQDLTGQWKGNFINNKSTKKSDQSFIYVIELKLQGKNLIGNSYSYYTENGKKYYSICTVVAKKKMGSDLIDVWETKRTKTNNNSSYSGLQHHKLYYKKNGNEETMSGTWEHIYHKNGRPGAGKTFLKRNQQQKTLAQISKAIEKRNADLAKAKLQKGKAIIVAEDSKSKDSSILVPSTPIMRNIISEAPKKTSSLSELSIPEKVGSYTNYLSRKKNVVRTIYTNSSSLEIDIYDNGEIDGDSITVLYDDKILQFKQMLKSKPLSFTVQINQENTAGYVLVMFAENLGTIPPNTALMIITDAKKRYEVRVSSDLQQSGAIKFIPQKAIR